MPQNCQHWLQIGVASRVEQKLHLESGRQPENKRLPQISSPDWRRGSALLLDRGAQLVV